MSKFLQVLLYLYAALNSILALLATFITDEVMQGSIFVCIMFMSLLLARSYECRQDQ